jgi:putative spermidine/putrescine transport system ATP-binding protein
VRKTSASVARDKVAAALDKVRLREFAKRKPQQLSGGQQQRVALARALVFEPRVVLMDEPLSALDKKLREEMQLEIRRLHRELGVTMVFVTHDQAEARTLSDRVALFNHGRVEQVATPKQLYEMPANSFVAGFIGDNNMLRGARDAERGCLRTPRGALLRARSAGVAPNGEDAILCVRPEALHVAAEGAGLSTENRLDATLVDAIHQGDHWRLVMQLHDGDAADGRAPEWFAKIGPALPAGLDRGRRVSLGFRADDAWMY